MPSRGKLAEDNRTEIKRFNRDPMNAKAKAEFFWSIEKCLGCKKGFLTKRNRQVTDKSE